MVSVITVNYNNAGVTLELLRSIARFKDSDMEVIVVDNGSRDNPEQSVRSEFPWARLIRSEKNLGFAGGNNLGIRHAKGDYLFFINNDTEFTSNIIPHLVSILEMNPHIGVLSPVIYYFDAPRDVQYAGYTPLNKITGRNRCITSTDNTGEGGFTITSYAHGAAMMIPRHVVELAGMMPESYFLYYEEFDWCEIIKRRGYAIAVDTTSSILHKESRTTGVVSDLKSYFMSRNRILFMRRNSTGAERTLFWFYFILVATPKELLKFFFRRQWKNISAHMAGIGWNLRYNTAQSRILGYKFNYLNQYE